MFTLLNYIILRVYFREANGRKGRVIAPRIKSVIIIINVYNIYEHINMCILFYFVQAVINDIWCQGYTEKHKLVDYCTFLLNK